MQFILLVELALVWFVVGGRTPTVRICGAQHIRTYVEFFKVEGIMSAFAVNGFNPSVVAVVVITVAIAVGHFVGYSNNTKQFSEARLNKIPTRFNSILEPI